MKKTFSICILALLVCSALSQTVILRNPGCNAYDHQGICKSCSTRFYKDVNNICQPVNPNCRTYDQRNGDCLSCYPGFGLLEGTCLPGIEDEGSLDPNCNQFNDKVCIKCSFGYYFDKDNKCTKADLDCATFDIKNGDCISCYPSFALSQGKCIRQVTKQVDTNCNQFGTNNMCIKCSSGYYFIAGLCKKIDDSCKDFDIDKKICKRCYPGYVLSSQTKCVQEAPKENPNPLCAEWNGELCVKCSKGSAFDSKGKCFLQDAYCRTFDIATNTCKRCYTGYAIQNGACKLEDIKSVSDLNCNSFSNGKCTKCSTGYYFNSLKVCVKMDDSCKSFSVANNRCMECYSGYQLSSSGQCVLVIQDVRDPLCTEWNKELCVKCSFGAFFNSLGVCSQADSSCKNFDKITGKCSTCYTGYTVTLEGACAKFTVSETRDPNCAQWGSNGNLCLRCAPKSFFNEIGLCELVDPLCRTSNMLSGACTSCFFGYDLTSIGKCQKSIAPQDDPLCAQFADSKCVKCAFGAFFNKKVQCQLADSLCSQFNKVTGECSKCYPGHALKEGKCEIDTSFTVSDPFCADFQNNICKRCSIGYYFEKDGKCRAADPLCATFSQKDGRCLSCFVGYMIQSGLCVQKPEDARDPNCAIFIEDKTCKQCSKGFFFNPKSQNCQLGNPLCKKSNQNGACTSCYSGYVIQGVTCVLDANAQSSFCAEFIEDICVRCASRTFLNSLGQCEKVSEDCRTYDDFNGQCLSCYSGFALRKGKCIKDTIKGGCSQFNVNNKCIKCAIGFYLNLNMECVQVDPQCAKFNFSTNVCEGCYSGYTLLEGRCEVSKVNEQFEVKNCMAYNTENKCIQCFERFYLSANQCKDVNVFCKTYDLITGECKSCYTKFKLRNGQCSK